MLNLALLDPVQLSFTKVLMAIAPGSLRALWLPNRSDGLTTVSSTALDFTPGRVWTAEATMQGRMTPQGNGVLVTFNGTSNILTTADTNDTSFGNGTVDSPFSTISLVNLTNVVSERAIISKYQAGLEEWIFEFVNGQPALFLYDKSAVASPFRRADAAITASVTTLVGATYSAATGGITAANDIAIYVNGVVVSSSATNIGTYVAMENLTGLPAIGRYNATAFFAGKIGFVAVYAANLSANQHKRIKTVVNNYFGLNL